MASRQIAEADSNELAIFLENDTSLARKGQSESAANLSRAYLHVVMESLISLQEGLSVLATKTAQPLAEIFLTDLTRCKQVIDAVNLIAYKQERRDASGN